MVPSLLACIRAMRADYCGSGLSFTEPGTPLGIYDLGAGGTGGACDAGGCFEASWNGQGANCISHQRYEHLIRLATVEKLATLAQKFPSPLSPIEVPPPPATRVPPSRPPAEAHSKSKPIPKKIMASEYIARVKVPVHPGTDLLPYCAPQYQPLSQCLAQYTDFYYDDLHPMPTAGAWNPVDAVTAQYVCKAGATRGNSLARTRTKVRWAVPPIPPNQVEALDCCDTLGCP